MLDDGLRKAFDGVPVVQLAQRHHQVQALAATGFQKRRQTQLREEGLHQLRSLLHLRPRHPLAGVEVEHHAVGVFERPRAGVQRVELDHVPLRRRQQALGVRHFEQRRVADEQGRIELPDAGQFFGLGVLLEKQFAVHARGSPHQGHRPRFEVRHHQLADQPEVTHEVDLGGAGEGVDDAAGVGHASGAGQRLRRGCARRAHRLPGFQHAGFFSHDGTRFLVCAQAAKHRVADVVAGGPFAERHLGHQNGLHPARLAFDGVACGERAGIGAQ